MDDSKLKLEDQIYFRASMCSNENVFKE